MSELARQLLALIDLTSLNAADDEAAIRRLASLASTPAGNVAAVCIWPRFIPVARAALRETGIAIATVTNFPDGAGEVEAAANETAAAVDAGADEVDVVFPYHALLSGDAETGLALVRACREACGDRVLLKVILETGRLHSTDQIRRAAEIAVEGGADFLKTSTGKTQPGATPQAAAVLLEVIAEARGRGREVGLKPSGGIGTIADAHGYLALYERRLGSGSATAARFRIGASSLMNEVLAALR
jgi:deoxyribose-phosphate aldolase